MSDIKPDPDFGRILEDFERGEDRRSGRPQERGRLIRQKEPDEPGRPTSYEHPTEEEDFAAALAAFESERPSPAAKPRQAKKPPQPGDVVQGTLLSIDLETSFIDIGGKAEAVIATADLADSDGVLLYKAGDPIQAEVVGRDEGTGSLRLRPQGGGKGDPRGPLTPGDVVEGTVAELNKGGLDIDLKGRRAFCPISQIADRFVEDASEFVGRKLKFEVTRYEEGRGRHANIVVSRKALLVREKEARAAVTRASLEPGAVVTGTVTSLADYGAFIDLGGLDGLVHVSEISYHRVGHPKEVLTEGQQVQVKIEKIERRKDGRDRISLSMKSLERDPWLDAVGKWKEDTVTQGLVRRLESFGAFVELEPGVEGLVHISELGAGRRLSHPREVLQPGQQLAVKVLNLDPAKKRISLSAVDPEELIEGPSLEEIMREKQGPGGGSGFGAMAHFFQKGGKKSD